MVGSPTASAVFDFENILPQLDFLPIAARRALDHAGLRLSLEAWRSLGLEDRCQLVAAGANDLVDSAAVSSVVRRASPPAQRIEVVGDPDPLAPPDGLTRLLEPVPLDARQWGRLRALDRYALAHVHRRSIARNDPSLIQAAYEDIVMGHLRSLRPPPGEAGGRSSGSTTPPPIEVPGPPPIPRDTPAPPRVAASPRAASAPFAHDARAFDTSPAPPRGTDPAPRLYDTPTPPRNAVPGSGRVQHTTPSLRRLRETTPSGGAFDGSSASHPHGPAFTPEPPRVSAFSKTPLSSKRFEHPDDRPAPAPDTAEDLLGLDHDLVLPELTPPRQDLGGFLSSHLDEAGRAQMVDVGSKPVTARRAVAAATVHMRPETFRRLAQRDTPKGDVLAAARIAGIQAAKRTSELIPLCHAVALTRVEVDLELDGTTFSVQVTSSAEALDRTGVEMEALVAASIASLTIYDMLKGIDRDISVTDVRLMEKSGGRTGLYQRREA